MRRRQDSARRSIHSIPGGRTALKATAALAALVLLLAVPIARGSQEQPDRTIQGNDPYFRDRQLVGVMSQWGKEYTSEDINDGGNPNVSDPSYSRWTNMLTAQKETESTQKQMKNPELNIVPSTYAVEEMQYRWGDHETMPKGVTYPDQDTRDYLKKGWSVSFAPMRKFWWVLSSLAGDQVQSVMAHLDKEAPDWKKGTDYYYLDTDKFPDGVSGWKPYPMLNQVEFMKLAPYLPKTLQFFQGLCAHIAANYGPSIGYYELFEEPGYDLRESLRCISRKTKTDFPTYQQLSENAANRSTTVVDDQYYTYDLDFTNEQYPSIPNRRVPVYFAGWATRDLLPFQQAVYSAVRENDPEYGSYVISPSLADKSGVYEQSSVPQPLPDGRVPETYTAERLDTYNRVLDDMGRPGQDLSVRVDSSKSVYCERPMYFNYQDKWPGGHTQFGSTQPSRDWYFAEGATYDGPDNYFEEYITIQNPQPEQANVTVTYMFGSSETKDFTCQVPARSRKTISVNSESEGVGKNQDVSARVSSDQEIVCERPMYCKYGSKGWTGGDVVLGVNSPRNYWYFAEGCTRPGFREWLCIQNPGDNQANVGITYMLEDGNTAYQCLEMPPKSRRSVNVNGAVGWGHDVSAKVESNAESPIVVERPMYFDYEGKNDRSCTGCHVVTGATRSATEWNFAEGSTQEDAAGGQWFDTWVCIQNPADEGTLVDVTYSLSDGSQTVQHESLGPHQRKTIYTNEVLGPKKDMGIKVKCEDGKFIVCERPMYFNHVRKYRAMIGKTSLPNPDQEFQSPTNPICIDKANPGWRKIPGRMGICNDFTNETKYNLLKTYYGSLQPPQPVPDTPTQDQRDNYRWAFCREAVDGGTCVVGQPNTPPDGPQTLYFAEGRVGTTLDNAFNEKDCSGGCFEEYLCIYNPWSEPVDVTLTFQTKDGVEFKGSGDRNTHAGSWYYTQTYKVLGHARKTIDVNHETGLSKTCDAIGVHLFGDPDRYHKEESGGKDSGWTDPSDKEGFSDQCGGYDPDMKDWTRCRTYTDLEKLIKVFSNYNLDLRDKELVVTSWGWPHADSANRSQPEAGHTDPTAEGQLFSMRALANLQEKTSCNKVWVYLDQDSEDPGENWDGCFGFFGPGLYPEPYPAWNDPSGRNGPGTCLRDIIGKYNVDSSIPAPPGPAPPVVPARE